MWLLKELPLWLKHCALGTVNGKGNCQWELANQAEAEFKDFCKGRTKLWLHGTTLPNPEQFLSLLYLLYTSNLFPDPLNNGKMRHDEAGRSWQATGHSLLSKKSMRGKKKRLWSFDKPHLIQTEHLSNCFLSDSAEYRISCQKHWDIIFPLYCKRYYPAASINVAYMEAL